MHFNANLGHSLQRKLPVYYQREEADFTQVESSLRLFVFNETNLPDIRKPPTTLMVHQGKVAVRLLHPGLVRKAVEEALPCLVEPPSNPLRNLGVQHLETLYSCVYRIHLEVEHRSVGSVKAKLVSTRSHVSTRLSRWTRQLQSVVDDRCMFGFWLTPAQENPSRSVFR